MQSLSSCDRGSLGAFARSAPEAKAADAFIASAVAASCVDLPHTAAPISPNARQMASKYLRIAYSTGCRDGTRLSRRPCVLLSECSHSQEQLRASEQGNSQANGQHQDDSVKEQHLGELP